MNVRQQIAFFGIGLVALLTVNAPARAQEATQRELQARIAALETTLFQLTGNNRPIDFASHYPPPTDHQPPVGQLPPTERPTTELASFNAGYGDEYCPDCYGDSSYCSCRPCGLYVGVEATALNPYISGANFGGAYLADDYGIGMRGYLGVRNQAGQGFRARYWTYNHGADLVAPGAALGINNDVIDGEATTHQYLGDWDVELSGGVRYAKTQYTTPGVFLPPGVFNYEGLGPTVAVDVRRQVGGSKFTLVGNLRGSFLIGEINNTGPLAALGPRTQDDTTTVWENQLGLVYCHALRNSWQLEVRTVWETQFWLNDTLSDDVFGIGSMIAYSGPTLAIELGR